ncbi:MAG: acetolactate synthase [Planctomycetaceae bacterium]|nr:acetolactate synthase [Planctomycetaceae bacterium]
MSSRKKRGNDQQGTGAGEAVPTATERSRSWPCLRQFAVFVENRVGRLHELLRLFESHEIRVVALSIANSVDCAFVRIMVHDADRGREILQFSKFAFAEIDLIGVELPDGPQPFVQICLALLQAELNVQYTYPLLYNRGGRGAIALYVDDVDLALQTLNEKGLKIVTESDLLLDDEMF